MIFKLILYFNLFRIVTSFLQFLALLLGVLFLGQDDNNTYDQAGIMNVNGALYNIIINLTFTNMFAVVAVIIITY